MSFPSEQQATLIQLFSTVALVVITACYVKITRNLSKQGEERLSREAIPILGLKTRVLCGEEIKNAKIMFGEDVFGLELTLENLGKIPTLDIKPYLVSIIDKENVLEHYYIQYIAPSCSESIKKMFVPKIRKDSIKDIRPEGYDWDDMHFGIVYRNYDIYFTCRNHLKEKYKIKFEKKIDVDTIPPPFPNYSWYSINATKMED